MENVNHETLSLWTVGLKKRFYPELDTHHHADVCVIGGGIAGMSTAYCLVQAGLNVVLVEKGEIGGVQTSRTTAHLAHVSDHRFVHLNRIHGVDSSKLFVQSHHKAIEKIKEIVKSEGIKCEIKKVDGYLFLGPDHDLAFLEEELKASRNAGVGDSFLLSSFGNAYFDLGPCIFYPNQAQIHPLKFLYGLAEKIREKGGRIFENTRVVDIKSGVSATVTTHSGFKVYCRHVVMATNAPIASSIDLVLKATPYRTYVCAFKIPGDQFPSALLWDTADPYHYVRKHRHPVHGDLMLIGGEDHRTGQEKNEDDPFSRIEIWARKKFPFLKETKFRWSGQVIESMDHVGFIGAVGDLGNLFVVTGDSGQGMTHGMIGGMLITDLIFGKVNPWTDLYDPSRIKILASPQLMKDGINIAAQYSHWIKSPDHVEGENVESLSPESGMVVNRGLHRVAVYKTNQNKLIEKSAVCPHMKGIVHWNSIEKTWDCPCHGSRFTAEGKLINGPAITDLEDVNKKSEKDSEEKVAS